MVVKNLGPTHGRLVASPALLARQGTPASPHDLARMDTIAMESTDGTTTWKLRGPDEALFTFEHHPRLVADDLLTLLQAARDGLGITFVPDYMCRDELQSGELVLALPGWEPPPAIVHAVFPSRRGLLPAVRQFLDFLGEEIGGVRAAPLLVSARTP